LTSTNISLQVSGLMPSATYYFTFAANNSQYGLWATNVQIFTTLTPTLPTPILPVNGVGVTNGVPFFSFTAAAGCKYRLDYKDTLADAAWATGDWITNATGNPLLMTLTDPSATGQPQRFYRLEAGTP
jgi:hypothetical protein